MKILLVTNAFPPNIIGGGEFSASNLVRVLLRNHYQVSVLTMAEPAETELWNEPMEAGFNLFRLHFPRAFTPFRANKGDYEPNFWQWKLWNAQDIIDPRGASIVKKVLDIVQPDHINIHSLSGFGYNCIASLARHSPVTWVLHDLSLACVRGGMFVDGHPCITQCKKCLVISRLKAHFIRRARRLAFISPSLNNLQTVQRCNPAVREKPGYAIPNIPDLLPPDMPHYEADKAGKCRILFVGRLHVTKGLDVVLEALEPLATTFDFSISIFGRGPEEHALKARYGHMSWCIFRGFVEQDDVSRAVVAHDLLCTPSIWAEPYGRVTAQALQLGTPVFGSKIGGTTELVRDEETGLLIEPGNVDAWRSAFLRVLEDPAILARWRDNTSKYAHEFDENAVFARYEEAFAHTRSM